MVLVHLSKYFFDLICNVFETAKKALLVKINLFIKELFDPNYKKRPTTFCVLYNLALDKNT